MVKAIAFDFNGTVAATFEASPLSGMNVQNAYELSIKKLFGSEAHQSYVKSGGLRNRAPSEVVVELHSEFGDRLFDLAFSLGIEPDVYRLRGELDLLFSDGGVRIATELMVQEKMLILTACIGEQFDNGSTWPRPMPGFCEYWQKVSADDRFATVIISSGHAKFIKEWLKRLGLSEANSMVTDDDLRNLKKPVAKPDLRIFERAMCPLWERFPGIKPLAYFGDDPVKDGQMAANVGVPFYLFDPTGANGFADWGQAPVPYG